MPPNQSVPLNVHAENEGLYSIVIRDSAQREVAERNLQLANNRVELEHTGRDMENLRQWASLTGGAALTEEDAQDTDALALTMQKQIQLAEKSRKLAHALGPERLDARDAARLPRRRMVVEKAVESPMITCMRGLRFFVCGLSAWRLCLFDFPCAALRC